MQATTTDLDKATKRKICREYAKGHLGDMQFVYSHTYGRRNFNGHRAFVGFEWRYRDAMERLRWMLDGHDRNNRALWLRMYYEAKSSLRKNIEDAKYAEVLPLP